jgi:beta-lactamase class C
MRLMTGLFLLTCFHAGAANASDRAAIDRLIGETVAPVMERFGIPGMAVALTVDGKRHFREFGVASRATGQAVDRQTLFEIGSISKTFTATLAALAQLEGKQDLSASIGSQYPPLEGSRIGEMALIHLATHTAGGLPLQVPENIRDDREMLDYFRRWQPACETGGCRTYSNPGIGLLGTVTASNLGMPFAAAMKKHVFDALALRHSHYEVPARQKRHYAQGYTRQGAPVRLNPGVLADEAYGVKTTSGDLLRYLEAGMDDGDAGSSPAGGGPLAPAMRETRRGFFQGAAMTQDMIWEQYPYPVTLENLQAGNADGMAYRPNAVTALRPPLPALGDAWVNKTGSTNGFAAYVAFIPARRIGIVILANRNYPIPARVEAAWRIVSALAPASK